VTAFLRPGRAEVEVADMLHAEIRRRGLETSWAADHCPTVNAGAASEAGHAGPTDIAMQPGDLVHLDFGIAYEGYRADLQRMWYLRSETDPEPPASVRHAFRACVDAIEAGRAKLKAGVQGADLLGPAALLRLRGKYRAQLVAKTTQPRRIASRAAHLLSAAAPAMRRAGLTAVVDVDPQSL